NAALVDRMRALSSSTAEAAKDASKNDNKDASKDDSPLFCTIDNLRKDNDALATQLRESAKLMARYKKQWKRQAAQLRDTVYRVLGFRVDFLASGAVRFTSTYAQDIDHNFVFSLDPHNPAQMRMIGGACKPYLQELMNDMRFWVQERGSIPGFMATVTLQNFEARPVGSSDPLPPPPIED
ncbi:coiled-coil domain-containing protein mad1, partial [Coemansia sp. RSA 2052]